MKKEHYLTILVLLLSTFPLMLNNDLIHEPRSSIVTRDKGAGTTEKLQLDEGRASATNDFSSANRIAGITEQISRDPITIWGDAAFTSANAKPYLRNHSYIYQRFAKEQTA
ncbi:MAG: hypothetical protein ACW964_02560 [Candidatus Hodarchaeales archaeon]|jgi:hypothetical protein